MRINVYKLIDPFIYIAVLIPVLIHLVLVKLVVENNLVSIPMAILYVIVVFMVYGIIDMLQVLKRLGVTKLCLKKNESFIKEAWYLFKYGTSLLEGVIGGNIDSSAAYTHRRYTNCFYKRYLKSNKSDNNLMVKAKMRKAQSKSFIMKNNIPSNVTEEEICQRWREPGTDIIFYGPITVLNIIGYLSYFILIK